MGVKGLTTWLLRCYTRLFLHNSFIVLQEKLRMQRSALNELNNARALYMPKEAEESKKIDWG